MEDKSNIINNYQSIYIFSRRYMLMILAITIGTGGFFMIDKYYDKHILVPNETDIATNLQNPFTIQDIGGIVRPISQQNDSRKNDFLSTNNFLNQNIYVSKKADRETFEKKMETINGENGNNNISVNNDLIKYFNLSCLFVGQPIDTKNSKFCKQNLDIFIKTFPKYNIEEDLGNFEKIVSIADKTNKTLICQNILQYVYQKGKIYNVFDNIMFSCPPEQKIYNQIVELKRFTRDEQKSFTNKKYNTQEINDLKMVSWMQNIYQVLQKPKIDLVEIKMFLNWLYNKTYLSSPTSSELQKILYGFNNFITTSLNNYQNQNTLSTEDTEYIKNIYIDMDNINSTFTIINKNNEGLIITTGNDNTTTTFTDSDNNIQINALITKYLGATITESKFVSADKYIYKITIGNAKRGLLIIKTDNAWTLKTLLVQKQNGTYEKVNDFSVKFDDSESKWFDIFKQKSSEIYEKVK